MEQHTEETPEPNDRSNRLAASIGLGVLGLWGAWVLGLGRWLAEGFGVPGADAAAAAGQFGDLFGGLNALFTALAFGAVAWSALSQRHEMAMQRREMAMQREQLALQRQALKDQEREMAEQRKVFQQQAFESTYFQMLGQCRELHDQVAYWDTGTATIFGGDAFSALAGKCSDILKRMTPVQGDEYRMKVGMEYESTVYAGRMRTTLGPYFRNLYHLFKLIDAQASMSQDERTKYANLARAHLSGDTVLVLGVNGCSGHGDAFRPLIERFHLLKHVEINDPSRLLLLKRCFRETAFSGAAPFTAS